MNDVLGGLAVALWGFGLGAVATQQFLSWRWRGSTLSPSDEAVAKLVAKIRSCEKVAGSEVHFVSSITITHAGEPFLLKMERVNG